jgi:hypothetical protein
VQGIFFTIFRDSLESDQVLGDVLGLFGDIQSRNFFYDGFL